MARVIREAEAPDGLYAACQNIRYDGDCDDETHGGHFWDGENWRYRDLAAEAHMKRRNGQPLPPEVATCRG